MLKFVAHHLWRPRQREIEPDHGMPAGVAEELRRQGFLRVPGPHAPATVRRRLANWSTLTRWRGLEGSFSSPSVKSAIRLAVRALNRPRSRKSANAITGDILGKLLATCSGGDLTALRDRAILMVAFASGGRRRSEIASLRIEQLVKQAPVTDGDGATLPSLGIHLGRTKTSGADQDEIVYLTGRPVEALTRWLEAAKSTRAACFARSIAGVMFRHGRWNPAPSTGSLSSARKWRGWNRGVFCARPALRLSHRSGQSWYSAPRSDGTIPSSFGATGIRLLQQCQTAQRTGIKAALTRTRQSSQRSFTI